MTDIFAASRYATAHQGDGLSVERGYKGPFPAINFTSAGAASPAVFQRTMDSPTRPDFANGVNAPSHTV